MNPDQERELERNLFSKMEQMEREFHRPGVELSIKRKTDGTLHYVRRCMNDTGELEYNARWNIPFSSPSSVALAPVQEPLALMPPPPVEMPPPPEDDEVEEEEEDEVEEEEQGDEYIPPSQEEESEDFSFQSAQVNVKRDCEDDAATIPTEIDGSFLTQEGTCSKVPAGVTPSPKFRRGFCELCENSPCVSMIDGPFLIKRAEKKYEKEVENSDSSELLQKLSDEFLEGYKLIREHELYVPGDGEITDVDVPMCMYTRFHEWSKDLL